MPHSQADLVSLCRANAEVAIPDGIAVDISNGWRRFAQPQFSSRKKCREYFVALNKGRLTAFVER